MRTFRLFWSGGSAGFLRVLHIEVDSSTRVGGMHMLISGLAVATLVAGTNKEFVEVTLDLDETNEFCLPPYIIRQLILLSYN